MRLIIVVMAVAALLAACTESDPPGPNPALGQGAYAAAPPAPGGMTAPDRGARRAYYRGPRGHEF